jgi:hypothetical protein
MYEYVQAIFFPIQNIAHQRRTALRAKVAYPYPFPKEFCWYLCYAWERPNPNEEYSIANLICNGCVNSICQDSIQYTERLIIS